MLESASEVFDAMVRHRRAVRVYQSDCPVPPEVMQRSLARAVLSPNSSNLQLWEFYWIRSPEKKAEMHAICLGQNAARTAQELVVVAVRRDLWRARCAVVLDTQIAYFKETFGEPLTPTQQRVLLYWKKYIPLMYRGGFGFMDLGKTLFAWMRGLREPTPREVTTHKMHVSAHRSAALAAMTFMHSLTAEGFDTCPMEGFDSARLRRLLNLPRSADLSMVIAVGRRAEKGVYGPRLRLPMDQVVFEV